MQRRRQVIDAIVPARNAGLTLGAVLSSLPLQRLRSVVVVDRDSDDVTSQIARDHGAVVLRSPHQGYGMACLTAQQHLAALPTPPDSVLFVPGDEPNDAAHGELLLAPLLDERAELVLATHKRRFAPTEQALLRVIRTVYGHRFHGFGSCRALRFPALVALGMSDQHDGWDVELVVRALKLGLSIAEIRIDGSGKSPTPAGRSIFHILRHATLR